MGISINGWQNHMQVSLRTPVTMPFTLASTSFNNTRARLKFFLRPADNVVFLCNGVRVTSLEGEPSEVRVPPGTPNSLSLTFECAVGAPSVLVPLDLEIQELDNLGNATRIPQRRSTMLRFV